jgi:hypothetical protein
MRAQRARVQGTRVQGTRVHSMGLQWVRVNWARIMLNFLLAHKIAIGRILSVIGATATVVIFEYFFELAWYVSIPVGALAYVTMPMLWIGILDAFEPQAR